MSASISARPAVVGTFVWLAVATAVGFTGVIGAVPMGPQLIALTLIHVVRFIGIAFLVLGARGELSPLFAERAGWGDLATATIAVVLLLIGLAKAIPPRALVAWNVFGIIDLIVAVTTAAFVVVRGDVPGMDPLLRLPLVLVPIFAVPLLFATHIALFRRLWPSIK